MRTHGQAGAKGSQPHKLSQSFTRPALSADDRKLMLEQANRYAEQAVEARKKGAFQVAELDEHLRLNVLRRLGLLTVDQQRRLTEYENTQIVTGRLVDVARCLEWSVTQLETSALYFAKKIPIERRRLLAEIGRRRRLVAVLQNFLEGSPVVLT